MTASRSILVAGVLLGLVLTGCSAATSDHAGPQALPATSTGSTLARPPAPSAPSAWPSTLSPVAMVGSQVYDDHGHHDSRVRDVATYLNTRGGLVVADREGTVWLTSPHGRPHRIGRYDGSLMLVSDAGLQEVGWLTGLDDRRQVLHVVDTRASRAIGTISLPPQSRLVGIDRGSAYVVDHTPQLLRIDLASGTTSTIPLRHPLDVEAVMEGHLFVFVPGRSYLAPVSDLGQRRHVPLVDLISPGLRYGTGLEGDDVRDLATGDRVPIHVPTAPHEKVTFYGWLGPATVAFAKVDLESARWNLYSCDLVSTQCHLTVSVPQQHLVGPGGWSPPAG